MNVSKLYHRAAFGRKESSKAGVLLKVLEGFDRIVFKGMLNSCPTRRDYWYSNTAKVSWISTTRTGFKRKQRRYCILNVRLLKINTLKQRNIILYSGVSVVW